MTSNTTSNDLLPARSVCMAALLSLAACSVQANASATVHADGEQLDADASLAGAGAGESEVLQVRVKIRKQGDELVQEGGEINFAYDAATLEGEATFATLQAYADLLARYPAVTLRIEGHTDSRGSEARNRELSQRRAEAVRDWLVAHGVAAERLEAVGLGEDRAKTPEPPACHNKRADSAPDWCDAQVWAANRRSEFHVVEGGDTLPDGELTASAGTGTDGAPGRAGARAADGSGAYVFGSPGLLSLTLGSREELLSRRPSYRWGVGAGYLWRRDKLAVALGLGLSHVPVSLDPGSERCVDLGCGSVHDLLVDVELRLGGGSPRLIGYGLLAPGLALGVSRTDGGRYVTPGFGLDFGAGLWGRVWRGLFLGGEVLVSPGIYASQPGGFHSSATHAGLGLRAMLGWQFGWRADAGQGR